MCHQTSCDTQESRRLLRPEVGRAGVKEPWCCVRLGLALVVSAGSRPQGHIPMVRATLAWGVAAQWRQQSERARGDAAPGQVCCSQLCCSAGCWTLCASASLPVKWVWAHEDTRCARSGPWQTEPLSV